MTPEGLSRDKHEGSHCGDRVNAFMLGQDFPGMRSQLRGLVNRAGWRPSFKSISSGSVKKFIFSLGPHWFRRKCLCSTQGEKLGFCDAFKKSNVIVSIGGCGANFGKELRSKDRPVVQIQNPRQVLSNFDLIIACHHDNISANNVLVGRNALHDLSPEVLSRARNEWEKRFIDLPKPLTVALIGGSNGRFSFGKRQAYQIASILQTTKRMMGGTVIVSSSRRTDRRPFAALSNEVRRMGGKIWPNDRGRDAYVGLLTCADNILVTVDSVSMISEAVATTAPVSIFLLPGRSRRIRRFVEDLEIAGRVKIIGERECLPDPRPVFPLDDTDDIIGEMHHRLGF